MIIVSKRGYKGTTVIFEKKYKKEPIGDVTFLDEEEREKIIRIKEGIPRK